MSDPSYSEKPSSIEVKPDRPNSVGKAISLAGRLSRIKGDPTINEAYLAAQRSVLNSILVVADSFGGVPGEFIAGIPELQSFIGNLRQQRSGLTPDASKKSYIIGQALDLLAGTVIPGHAFPAYEQFRHDLPRIRDGLERTGKILRGEISDYQASKPQIDSAMRAFGVSEPVVNIPVEIID